MVELTGEIGMTNLGATERQDTEGMRLAGNREDMVTIRAAASEKDSSLPGAVLLSITKRILLHKSKMAYDFLAMPMQ